MRRGGPPILPIDPAAIPAFSRVEFRGHRGLRLAPAPPPAGAAPDEGPPLRLRAGAPAIMREAAVVAGGKLALAMAPGVAFTVAIPHMTVVHDRRPPGLDRAVGAPGANAGLLHAADGWRVVVLPSLGDVAAGLGEGPVALRADGRRVAAVVDGGVEEWDLGTPEPVARHDGVPGALCYAVRRRPGRGRRRRGGRPRRGSGARLSHRVPVGRGGGARAWSQATRTARSASGRPGRRSHSPRGRRHFRVPARPPCRPTARWSPWAPPPARRRPPASCAPRTARWRAASRAPGSSPPRPPGTG